MSDVESSLAEIIWETSRADESTISATGANIVARAIIESDWLAARVADAVEQERDRLAAVGDELLALHDKERAARLALVAKIEALADELAERLSTVRVAERIRALLAADEDQS